MNWGRNYLFGENAITKCGEYYSDRNDVRTTSTQYYSLLQSTTPVLLRTTKYYSSTTPLPVIRILDVQDINIKAEACNLHCRMIWFPTWLRIAGNQAKMREFLMPSFILVTLTIGTYEKHELCGWNHETLTRRRIALSLANKNTANNEPWALNCGQNFLFPSLVCKSSFNLKEWLSHYVFTTAGLGQSNLFSSTLGWSDRGSKWYKLSIGWYRLGYRWVLPIFLQKYAKTRFKHGVKWKI